MSSEPLSNEVIRRICKHMNNQHKEALYAYADYYAGFKQPKEVSMVYLTNKAMELEIDGNCVQIPFNHNLTDSEDAHKTLVAMIKAIPKSQ